MLSKLEQLGNRFARRLLCASKRRIVLKAATLAIAVLETISAAGQAYKVTNLISDGFVPAAVTDTNFVNPWAMSSSANWWISTAGTGFNYVIPATTGTVSFKVIVPSGSNPSANGVPSGSVATSGATGMLLSNGAIANFLFSTLDGTISGWNGRLGTNNALSQIVINNKASGAVYTGLAVLNTSNGSFILAPNFASGAVEIYDSTYKPAKLAGNFSDPNLPSGYVPFGVHVLNSQVWVTYAQHTSTTPYRTVSGAGLGIVDVFDNTGFLVARVGTGGNLNAPWGVAIAPANFGIYSNDLLVGNFGDGIVNVYDPKTFTYVGQLMDSAGKSLSYAALWELLPGGTKIGNSTAVSGGDVDTVYFTAGLADEKHGLLGAISNGAGTSSTPTFGFTSSSASVTARAGTITNLGLSLAPVNGFTGNVTLGCSGLPAGAVCTFSPAQITVSPNAVSLASVTIVTNGPSAINAPPARLQGRHIAIALACFMPMLSFSFMRRRGSALRMFSVGVLFLCTACLIGCGDSSPLTPAGTSQIVITATSGSLMQQTTVNYTVQ